MSFYKINLLFLAICLIASLACYADVAPDPGQKRIALNLIVESQSAFPDYRFFIKSGAELKEITLQEGKTVTIEPLGGGAFYRAGMLLAVPKKALISLEETDPNDVLKAVYDGKVPGRLELVKHGFAREVPVEEASGWKDPVYRIEADGQAGLKAIHMSGGANESKVHNAASSGKAFWGSAGAAIVAGIFLVFGIAMLGILYFRRTSKQP